MNDKTFPFCFYIVMWDWRFVRFATGHGGGGGEIGRWKLSRGASLNLPFHSSSHQQQPLLLPEPVSPHPLGATTSSSFSSKLLRDWHQLDFSAYSEASVLSSTGTPASSWVPGAPTTQLLLFKGLGPGSAFAFLNSENHTLVPLFPQARDGSCFLFCLQVFFFCYFRLKSHINQFSIFFCQNTWHNSYFLTGT